MYIEKYKSNEIILVGEEMIKRIYNIFITWGVPMPDHFISNDYYYKAGNYLELSNYLDISKKNNLKYIREYIPKSYFEDEYCDIKKDVKYYIKDINLDNGEGIIIVNSNDVPKNVAKNKIIQEEIEPFLINGYKFDLRVLICVCRNGDILINDNILYRFANDKYDRKELKLLGNLTNTILNKNNKSVFYNDRYKLKETDINEERIYELNELYLKQLYKIIPKIYQKLLKIFNNLDKISKANEKKHFYIHGLDFISDENKKLYLLEINSPPGHDGKCGIHNYHDFFDKATKFIIKKRE